MPMSSTAHADRQAPSFSGSVEAADPDSFQRADFTHGDFAALVKRSTSLEPMPYA